MPLRDSFEQEEGIPLIINDLPLFSGAKGLRIRSHPTGPPSTQVLIMISPPTAQEKGTISRKLYHKSFISKPLESKTQFIALFDGRVAGPGWRLTRQVVLRFWRFTRLPRIGDPSEPS